MTTQFPKESQSLVEERFIIPGYYTWEQFETIEAVVKDALGLRIIYLDGYIEFMTLGEAHENIKSVLAIFLALYFFEKGIKFIPVGSATRRDKNKKVSFEPDESYYIGEKKEHPDLAVEVIITSGGLDKLEKYKRFKIAEVWFWENAKISIYRLRGNEYEEIAYSEFLPELDLALLIRCVQMPDILEARKEFMKGIRN
ncbi:MAG: Uma2 family endonuclease [Hydrococcus sp. Prado102]|jgi:Uma2 family endonuclease|nr:Uma2 family endonuclease [Hydrococcus sp. Prado102]